MVIVWGWLVENEKVSDKMNLQELTKQLASVPKSIYVIHSNELYLLEQIRDKFKALITDEERAMNFATYDLDETDIEVALEDAMTIPFFGNRRVIILEKPLFLTGETKKQRAKHNLDALLAYLEQPEPTTTLVFLVPYAKLDKRKKVVKTLLATSEMVDLMDITQSSILNLVQADINLHGYTIDQPALQMLMQRTNATLTVMMQELTKLYAYCYVTKQIKLTDVNDLVTKSLTENVFDLVNAVLERKTKIAIRLYHELKINGEEPLKMNALLIGQFRLLLQVKGLSAKVRSEKELATQLKVHPYRVKLASKTSRRFSVSTLSQAYLGLFELEKQLKSTQRDPEMLFELFMIKFLNK